MLIFQKGGSATYIVVTLTELTTIPSQFPLYYLFTFDHIETKKKVQFVLAGVNDLSTHKYRYNKWNILNQADIFADAPPGHYTYNVRQQILPDNLNEDAGNEVVEYGRMILQPSSEFNYTEYTTQTNYKSYNG